MTDQQCGLCLSCGAPFLPDIDEVDFFNREANLSILFLNTQFKRDPDIVRTYEFPKLCSQRQASHVIHVAYHQTALDFMCNHHDNDNDVGPPPPVQLPGNVRVPRVKNAAFLYYHTATGHKGPQAATWARPPMNRRLNFFRLFNWILREGQTGVSVPVAQSLKQTYDMCLGCNALMTQKSHFRFLLGLRGAASKNGRGVLVRNPVITQYDVRPGRIPLERAYGYWHIANNPRATQSPVMAKSDSEAPCIAYYLHMCLPHQAGPNNDAFLPVHANVRPTARALYLQLCWLVLEIACLATLLQEGTVTKRGSKRSHGMHQHRGVLDFYVSYFFWRMMQFEMGGSINQILDFVQWHQKYFWDARNCPELLSPYDRQQLIGGLMFGSTDKSARALVEEICRKLVTFYEQDLGPLRLHLLGQVLPGPPGPIVQEYFLPVRAARALRDKALEATRNDFQSAVGKFGINALLFRLIDLCEGYPVAFLRQLKDFRASWQWREIERVRLGHPGLETKAAFRLYFMCSLLFPPANGADPFKDDDDTALLAQDEFCSPWNAVMSLEAIGAFRYQAIDVPAKAYY